MTFFPHRLSCASLLASTCAAFAAPAAFATPTAAQSQSKNAAEITLRVPTGQAMLTIPRRRVAPAPAAAPAPSTLPPFRDDFDKLDSERWRVSGPWANGKTFGAGWKPENVRVEGGRLKLTLNNSRFNDKLPYSAGEIGTTKQYGFGRYEVRMKPVKHPGVISSFFTYTSKPRHDEIDIEFVGNNTSIVEFTYYTGGKATAVARHPLGFDAAEAFHDYAFEWRRGSITWFVDGKQAAQVAFAPGAGPEFAGAILMNAWPTVGADEWAGKFEYPGKPLVAEYEWVRWTPLAD